MSLFTNVLKGPGFERKLKCAHYEGKKKTEDLNTVTGLPRPQAPVDVTKTWKSSAR